jgi:hypothetical protein
MTEQNSRKRFQSDRVEEGRPDPPSRSAYIANMDDRLNGAVILSVQNLRMRSSECEEADPESSRHG